MLAAISMILAPLATTRTVVTAMAAGRTMDIRSGDYTRTVSLHGASASLLWIDERQGRLDTPVALRRQGERDASGVPGAPALPLSRAAAARPRPGSGPAAGSN